MIGHTVIGHGAIARLSEVVAEQGARRVLLVRGRRSFAASGAGRVLSALARLAEVVEFCDFRPNPDAQDVAGGLRVLADTDPDVVIAVGGGTAMDVAKLLVAYDGRDPADLSDTIRSGARITARRRGLVLVPTTSGSGAEATHFAVVYIGAHKYSIAGPALHADTVILDPQLSLSGSPRQRATSGIDAVAQAIESLWATGADDQSRAYAREALRLLLPGLVPYVNLEHPDNRLTYDITLGAHRAGQAIDISKTTAPHALSYGLTKGYDIPHGHAVGLTLGAFIAAHAAACVDQLQRDVDPQVHRTVMREILELLGAEDGIDAHHRIDRLLEELGLEPHLTSNGVVTRHQRGELAAAVNLERLGNNPVRLDLPGLARVLEQCG